MRIVDVCAFYTPHGGGVKTYVERKLKAGPAAGQEIIVLAPGATDSVISRGPGATLMTLASPTFPLDRRYRYFAGEAEVHRALDRLRPDLVEASSPWRSAATVARWRGSAPRTLIMHADPLAAYAYRWFGPIASRDKIDRSFEWFWRHLRQLDSQFDGIVSASADLGERLRAGGLRNVFVNPMGVEEGQFSPALRDRELRKALLRDCGLGEDATLLLGVGRLAPEKRWPMVIDAVTAAAYQRPIGFVLVGEGRDRGRIRAAIGGNPHCVLLPPFAERQRFATLMASADALIHGCEAETFCLVAAEARASGLPLIAPDRGGAADQARQSGGRLYAAADPSALSRAINELLDRPIDLARHIAIEGPGRVRRMDDHFAELFAFYQALVEGQRYAA